MYENWSFSSRNKLNPRTKILNCAALNLNDYSWRDSDCTEYEHFLCRKDIDDEDVRERLEIFEEMDYLFNNNLKKAKLHTPTTTTPIAITTPVNNKLRSVTKIPIHTNQLTN